MALSNLSLGFVSLALLAGLYKFILYPAFLSPLAKIPNAHFSAPFSPIWILWNRYKRNANKSIHAAHKKHGPIVRLAPNELSINCVDEGIRTVYAGGFEKHEWYPNQFPCYGKEQMFSYAYGKPHSVRKRMMSNIYSKSVLQGSPQLAANSKFLISTRLFPILEDAAKSKTPIDVWSLNNGFAMDFMSAYQFGLSCATNFCLDDDYRNEMLRKWGDRKPLEFFNSEIPRLSRFLERVGIKIFPEWYKDANDTFEALNLELCDRADNFLGTLNNVGDEPVVYKQLKGAMTKQNEKGRRKDPESGIMALTPEDQRLEIASEMLDHLGAGHETTAIALTYLYWEMCRKPEWQRKIRKELLSLSSAIIWPPETSDVFHLPSPKALDELPVLHAVLMETLRLHAPIPGGEPRITPAQPCTLAGYSNIPPKVRVQAQPYSLHRNPDVFPDPESWSPERWLVAPQSDKMKEMLRWFWAFGSGGRMCIGSNLAIMEAKLVIAAIFTNYSMSIVDDGGIEELDAYTTRPIGEKLVLRLEHAGEAR